MADDRRPSDLDAYPAEKARQGYIVLRTPLRRFIFIAGLVGIVIVVLAIRLFT